MMLLGSSPALSFELTRLTARIDDSFTMVLDATKLVPSHTRIYNNCFQVQSITIWVATSTARAVAGIIVGFLVHGLAVLRDSFLI